jgi:hypothetical protein
MADVRTQGAKEVREAVLIAVLNAALVGLVNWGLERAKAAAEAKRKKKDG